MRPSSPLDMPGGSSGDRIHCRCRPSFWDNVIMGGTAGSFVSCRRKFSTTSIMSATTQPWALRLSRRMSVFSCVLSFSLVSPFPPLPLPIYLYSLLHSLFFSSSPYSFISVTPHINLFLLHKSVCPHFYSYIQMPLHAKWSVKASEVYCISKPGYRSVDIRTDFKDSLSTFLVNI